MSLPHFQQGYALVIGVGADLPMTVNDAEKVAAMLLDPARCAYPPAQVALLTGPQAGRAAILAALQELAAVGPDATVVIYFSGHGIATPNYFLIPFGYNLQALATTAISGAEFGAALQAIPARKLLVLLDCCHAGGQVELAGSAKAPIPVDALVALARGSGRVVIGSSRRDELSWAAANSHFTTALLEGLAGCGAAEADGYARVLDLAMWVSRRVPELTQDRQHPIIKVSNLEDNFAVAWYAGGSKAIVQLRSREAAAPAIPAPSDTAPRDTAPSEAQLASWRTMLANYRRNLLLIEQRMSEYVEFAAVPLQLVLSRQQTEAAIAGLEQKLQLR